jgi:hypothetical protein
LTGSAGRRAKRFSSPLQKYEIFLQLVRQEVTVIEVAERWQVDRGVVMRIRTVAKEGALEALSKSRSGAKVWARDFELESARADAARLGEAMKEMAVKLMLVEGKGALGLSGRVPSRVDVTTKEALLGLLVANPRGTAPGCTTGASRPRSSRRSCARLERGRRYQAGTSRNAGATPTRPRCFEEASTSSP